MPADVAAIIPAAGAGTRVGGTISKLFVPLNGRPLLAHVLTVFQQVPAIRWIIPVVRSGDEARAAALLRRFRVMKAVAPCAGGASRAESVARGVTALPRSARWVLVHDGARPCVTPALISQAIRAGKRHGAVACGLPATLTVKAVDERRDVRLTLDRDQLWFVQTPQVFRRDWFIQALARTDHQLGSFPDDAAILESAGFPVRMILGDPLNLKITTKDELLLAEAILKLRTKEKEDGRR